MIAEFTKKSSVWTTILCQSY